MAEIVIAGNTSGSVTIAAPDVAGTTTLTLPATSGALVADNGSGTVTATAFVGNTVTANAFVGDGSGLTNLPIPTPSPPSTADVQTAIAGITAQSVGAYALCFHTTAGITISADSTYAGSVLRTTGFMGSYNGTVGAFQGLSGALAGTWRAMSTSTSYGGYRTIAFFLRIA